MGRRPFVLDSWAMMAFFENEQSAERVEELLLEAHRACTPLFISVVNAGEIWYITAREYSPVKADRVIEERANLRIKIVPADWQTSRQAAIFKSRGRIAYADCFAAALAKLSGGEIVTGDPEFKPLSREVQILWL